METPTLLQQEKQRRARVRAERKLLLQQTMIRRRDIQELVDAAQREDVESMQNVKKS